MTEREFWTVSTTKLQRPRVTAHLVNRPRLVERMNHGLAGPLTLVCASAGYGKTTLVSAWIEEMAAAKDTTTPPLPVTWLSLDEYDSDLTTFVRYVCAALRKVFPECCAQTLALVNYTRQGA